MPVVRRRANRWLLVTLLTATLALAVSAVALPAGSLAFSLGGSALHPELADALEEWPKARGGARYTTLRRMWQLWDHADPQHVEQVLIDAGRTQGISPALTAYARMLSAYARLRRGDLESARQRIAELSYVDDWLVLGPFDNEGKSGLERSYGPEDELLDPIVIGRGYSGHAGRVVNWRRAPEAFPYGWVDLGALVRPEHPVCVYATSFVRQPGLKAPRLVSLWVGARGAFRLFWNGVERLGDPAYRGHDFDRRAALVWLEPGENRVTLKVCGVDSGPRFSLRLADQSGAPDPKLSWSVDPAALSAGEASQPPLRAIPDRPRLEGPLQWFEREAGGPNATPAAQEDFARYLVVTGGDDPALHQARDLAAQAATRAPTVERLLLAGRLSEDRNAAAAWLSRASARAGRDATERQRLELLLAEAEHAENGLSPQAALPLYESALALAPGNVDALSGAARLLSSAGLERTALARVSAALEESPHSVALLHLQALALEELGRKREASIARDRYSALRFDDHAPLVARLELAIARRDAKSARHHAARLLELLPHSAWAHGIAARAEVQLGDSPAALSLYERALALAPEDVDTLRALSDLHGDLGDPREQLALLQQIVELRPQAQDVRDYIAAIEPGTGRLEEAFAWEPERFLKEREQAPTGFHRRTLLDLNVTHVYENGLSSRFRQLVFQPLTDTGAALGRQYSFVFQADRQRVQLKGARVYRANGKIDEAIESGTGAADNPELTMYTSARTFYVQFPRLEPNDIVELRYRIDDSGDKSEFAGYFGELEYLQSDVPVRHAEYVVITPKDTKLYVDSQRIPGLQREERVQGEERVQRFWAENLEAMLPEAQMPPWPEALGFVHVSTYPSYEALGEWYWGLSRDQLELDNETRELVRRITQGAETLEQKVFAVYDWVVRNTRYVALELGIYGYKPRRAVQTVARGWGDCKDKAVVIVAMLRELGIDSTLVIVRTGLRGRFQSSVASLAPFDHAVAYVPALDLYLDGTAELAGPRELPAMDQGALGLHVNQGKGVLRTLPDHDPKAHVRQQVARVTLEPSGAAALELELEATGPSASAYRHRYLAESTRRARVIEDVTSEFPGLSVLPGERGVQVSDLNRFEEPVRLSVTGRVAHLARREGERLSLLVTVGTRLVPRFASLPKRRHDVQLGAFPTRRERFEIALPKGYRVVAAPAPVDVQSRFGAYRVAVREEGAKVVVESELSLSVARVPARDYAEFRRFAEGADRAFEPRLVLGPDASPR